MLTSFRVTSKVHSIVDMFVKADDKYLHFENPEFLKNSNLLLKFCELFHAPFRNFFKTTVFLEKICVKRSMVVLVVKFIQPVQCPH